MTSVEYDDFSCVNEADIMSCDAMIGMAKAEVNRNNGYMGYAIFAPNCERYQKLADRGEEHALQKTQGISKKLCVEKRPAFNDGPWIEQLNPIFNPVERRFDMWTRAKGASVPCYQKVMKDQK